MMSESRERELTGNKLCEDSVQVDIFCLKSIHDIGFWENLCKDVNLTLENLSSNYIWHRDELKICLPLFNDNDDIPMHLTSTVCFGDNIEDEWYIVYLMFEISKKYNDLVIQIQDGDGDFLLIEAADYLPQWANPESTINRVFINNNAVHIIPPKLYDLKNEIKIKDALQILQNFSEQTKVSHGIQRAIQARMGQYPQKMEENFHKAIVKLPIDIAVLLTMQPSLIAPIVSTYCNHDMIDAKACRNLRYKDCIPVEVKFTKCLYAMLMHAKVIRHLKKDLTTEPNKTDVLGIKLTCGFQMIMEMLTDDIFCTKEYKNFEKNLKDNGYFKGNIENSLEHSQLLDKARKYFLDVECPINSFVSKKISDLLASDIFLRLKQTFKSENFNQEDLKEDNDDWLSINPNQLNDFLNNRYGNQAKFDKDDVLAPETIISKLTDFLKQTSDFEGVDTSKIQDTETDCIDFDPEEFEHCLEKMINFLSSDVNDINLQDDSDLESESDISDTNETELDKELTERLNVFENSRSSSKTVVFNLTQSMKEEGVSGPTSNILKGVGINKTDLLDSDDD